jgi:aminoglycoside phosphotransferase (APT) family kinase protein
MWAAEIVVTPELAAELIREQFAALASAAVTLLETGWDNTAFVVDGQWLFRFPRRQIALPGVQREIDVLPMLAPRLPLPIPDPVFVGQPTEHYAWPFFGARLLPGRELAASGLSEAARRPAAAGIGGFLRALHDPDLVPLVAGAGLPVDPMRRASPPARARKAREVLAMLARRGLRPASSEMSCLLDQAEAEPPAAGPPAAGPPRAGPPRAGPPRAGPLRAGPPARGTAQARARPDAGPAGQAAAPGHAAVAASPVTAGDADDPGDGSLVVSHGDLHVRHLLVEDGAATGVIDWGDLCLADPAVDLSIAYLGFAGAARAELLAAYGRPVTARRELAARTCAVSIGTALAEYAAAEDRRALLAESLAALHRAVS